MNAALYIATELSSPDTAQELLDAVDEMVSRLRHQPFRHPVYPALYAMKREIRFFPVKNYLIFYVVREDLKTVEIWRFLHQRQHAQEHL